jgi:acyl dehydratase
VSRPVRLHFEDFSVGQRFELGQKTVTAEEIVDYARDYDPQPFHLDEEAAAKSPFGGLIASGWQVGAFAMRLLADNLLSRTVSLGSPGLDKVEWRAPVRPGDTLSMTGVVLQVIPSRSKPDRGVVMSRYELHNQRGELVYRVEGAGMFGRRPQ